MAGGHVRGIVSKEVAAKFGIPVNVIRIEDAVVTSTWDPTNTGSENDMCIGDIRLDAGMSYGGICEVCSSDFEVIAGERGGIEVGSAVCSYGSIQDLHGRWLKPIRYAKVSAIAPSRTFGVCIEDITFKDGSVPKNSWAWVRFDSVDLIAKPQEHQSLDRLTDKEEAEVKNFIGTPQSELTAEQFQAIVKMLYIMYKSREE